ncbi:MAG: EamA family transporter RarD [Leptospirales bacterium]|nr:EamA family transporter RarD [Leptospirales bacterium]
MNKSTASSGKKDVIGTIYTIAAFTLWGCLPGYWKLLKSIPPDEIVFHRIVWTFVFTIIFVLWAGKKKIIADILKNRKQLFMVIFSSITIIINWLTYVYAINTDHIVQASLGYFINPLVSIFLGMIVLKERLTSIQIAALILASGAVLFLSIESGSFPWIAIILAFSFGLYGLIKKMGNLDSMGSLSVEMLFLLPVSVLMILFKECHGAGAIHNSSFLINIILIGTGIISAVPLIWFAHGTKMISLSRIGFIQYITPSLTLIIGVVIYKEAFTSGHAISFSLIWAALILYTLSILFPRKNQWGD